MSKSHDLSGFAFDQLHLALIGVIGFTEVHLGPAFLTRTIFKRARQQLAGITALLRRLIMVRALELEHEIEPDMSEANGFSPAPNTNPLNTRQSWSLFGSLDLPRNVDFDSLLNKPSRLPAPAAAPIITRIMSLQHILDAPETYARRLAFRLARQHEDAFVWIPQTAVNLRRLGTELSTIYPFLAETLRDAIFTRPPRVGPRPRPPPRIRALDW